MISIDYIKQQGSLRLIVGDSSLIEEYSSLYYWTIDVSFMSGDESERKALLNVINVLEGWQNYLREAKSEKSSALMPFDFSDEYIGYLMFAFSSEEKAMISYCCTREITGYSINPSDWRGFSNNENIVVEYASKEIEGSYSEIERDLSQSIDLLKSYL